MGTCAPSTKATVQRCRESRLPFIRYADWLTVASKDPQSTCKVNRRDHLTDFHGDPDTDLQQEDMQPGQAITPRLFRGSPPALILRTSVITPQLFLKVGTVNYYIIALKALKSLEFKIARNFPTLNARQVW